VHYGRLQTAQQGPKKSAGTRPPRTIPARPRARARARPGQQPGHGPGPEARHWGRAGTVPKPCRGNVPEPVPGSLLRPLGLPTEGPWIRCLWPPIHPLSKRLSMMSPHVSACWQNDGLNFLQI
jgi:hypothetical protein